NYQVPALLGAGYQAITFDSRGTPPSATPLGPYRLADLVADAVDLITGLGVGPCRIVGASLGAMVAQELALARPDLVTAVALLGTRCRTDFFRATAARAFAARIRGGVHTDYDAVGSLLQLFSRRTLADDRATADWFEVFRTFPASGPGLAAQYEATIIGDRTAALRGVRRPCLVVAFAEDVLTPPSLCREVADAIPGCRYVELAECGHFGFLEQPAEVNAALLDFFAVIGA
ncbi:MAG: alpha/beta fold hydrolase, partial [Pseudonocardiaceae bacterium]